MDPKKFSDIDPGVRVLMGPGPSDVEARVLSAMAAPCVSHLDPYMLQVMGELKELLAYPFETQNDLTIAVSGTGSSGMEACIVNLVEPGDVVLTCVNGFFAGRQAEIVERCGGTSVRVDLPWGRTADMEAVRKAALEHKPKIITFVHAETSTGVLNQAAGFAEIAQEVGALLIADLVTSLGGMPVGVDANKIDAAYSCSQKCLGCPPGLSPVTFSPAAVEKIKARKNKVGSFYLDMGLLDAYWSKPPAYHHTASSNLFYALREGLRIVAEEGLEARFARHQKLHSALVAGVEAMGLEMVVPEGERLPMLNVVRIPEGGDDLKVRQTLLGQFGLEIGGGLGDFAGQVWRVGLMGAACTPRNLILFLSSLETVLKGQGVKIGSGVEVATAVLI